MAKNAPKNETETAETAPEKPPEGEPTAPPSPPEQPAAAAADPAKRTPAEWCKHLGLVQAADKLRFPQRVDRVDWRHQAADALHGWTADAHHFQGDKAMRLTEEDYRKALDAAAKYPTVAPHEPALSQLKKDKFKGFKPRPSTRTAGPKIGSGKIGQGRIGA